MNHRKYLLLAFLAIVCVLLLVSVTLLMSIQAQVPGRAKSVKMDTGALGKIIDEDGAQMILVPAGEFEIGVGPKELPGLLEWGKKYVPELEISDIEDETPRHTVYVDAFYMDKYEVTNAQYQKFVDATGHRAAAFWSFSDLNSPEQPVVGVSWHDAVAYAKWAGKRLPTEGEWEKAARGGLSGKRYPWGDKTPDASGIYRANYYHGGNAPDGYVCAAPVGSFATNGYGLYDMAGNVWEWCADWYDSGYYANSPNNNPMGPGSGSSRVLRGGSWIDTPAFLRVAFRVSLNPSLTGSFVGFRCVSQD